MHQLISYIKFLLKSTNHHGVHSPFVFNFITKCFYDKTYYTEYDQIKFYRKKLMRSNNTINLNKDGRGTTKPNAECSVKQMVKDSKSSLKKTKLLFRIIKYLKCIKTLQINTHLGLETQALALYSKNNVTTFEGCSSTYNFTKSELTLKNITFFNLKFLDSKFQIPTKTFDCVYFNSKYSKPVLLNYFEELILRSHNDSVFIFNHIYSTKNMTKTWLQICNDPRVSVSIDVFHYGLVFFRKEQPKQHFIIRM